MASWRIVCAKRVMISHPEPHPHVIGVGTGDRADWADMRWTLHQVLSAMDEGDAFYTKGVTNGEIIRIERYRCPQCGGTYIRPADGSLSDSDLGSIRDCIYQGT
jgi:hypothetical protein